MKEEKDWSEYYKVTGSKPPRPLLIRALDYVAIRDRAIDIGGGALNETRYLLEQGFEVTVIDKSPLLIEQAANIQSNKLHPYIASFEDFVFPKCEFDLACAMLALPFMEPQHFDTVFKRIVESLKEGGVYCGQFFGVNDEWSKNSKMSFHTKQQVDNLLKDLEVVYFKEVEEDRVTAAGTLKHWHVFHVIAKK